MELDWCGEGWSWTGAGRGGARLVQEGVELDWCREGWSWTGARRKSLELRVWFMLPSSYRYHCN